MAKAKRPRVTIPADIKAQRIMAATFFGDPANALVYEPGPSQLLPDKGAWIMITRRLPPLEGGIDEKIRVGRVFFAERDPGAMPDGFQLDGTYKIRVRSPWGDVTLWPYEYSTIDALALMQMWQDGEITFHPMQIDAARLSEITFYAQSRGIPLAKAAPMALGTIEGPVGWFEPRADLAAVGEEWEERVHRWKWEKSPRTTKEPMTVTLEA